MACLGNALLATIVPFKGYKGALSVGTEDIDGDQILDIVVGRYNAGYEPRVIAYAGANYKFNTIIANFLAFDASFKGGVRLAAGMIGANGLVNNIIVASGTGMNPPVVKVFRGLNFIGNTVVTASYLAAHPVLTTPPLFAKFTPNANPCQPISKTATAESITSIVAGPINLDVSNIISIS